MGAAARPIEEQVLLECARASIAATGGDRLRALIAEPLDWPRLLAVAERHAMLSLVAHQIEALGNDSTAPETIRAELRSASFRDAAKSLMLTAELTRLLEALSAAGIPALPYKGPLLAVAAYGNAALRRMRDLDVIVPGAMLDRARELLAKRGYRQFTPLLPVRLRLRLEYQCGMIRDADGALVELHWRIAPPNVVGGPPFAELWDRRAQRTLNGIAMPGLSNEDRLLALCVHGSKHGWRRLEWIAAVAGVSTALPCDWNLVIQRATEVGARRMVRQGLILARNLLGSPVAPTIAHWIEGDAGARLMAAEVARGLFADRPATDADSLVSFQWRSQDTVQGKIRFALYWPLIRVGRRIAAWRRPSAAA